jgi:glycosyltransferase involved in cell wall biosynthesis
VTDDAGSTDRWSSRVPVHSLVDNRVSTRLIRAAGRRLGYEWCPPRTQSSLLEKVLRASKADTVLCNWGTYAVRFKSVLEASPQRLFIQVHGWDTHEQLCPPGYRDKLVSMAQRAIIICNSNTVRGRLLRWGILPERIVTKYPGVEVPPSPANRNGAQEVTILHLGRLVDCKSPDRTIQAFELACNRGLRGKLIIAGDGPLRVTCELLKARSKWQNRIKLTGAVTAEEGASLFASSDIFTLHSIRGELTGQEEAFGVAVVEAMAAALPVVSCRIAGIVETVIDQQTGVLVAPGDVEAQAETFLQFERDPVLRRRMGQAGWSRVKELFSWEREKAELLRILALQN